MCHTHATEHNSDGDDGEVRAFGTDYDKSETYTESVCLREDGCYTLDVYNDDEEEDVKRNLDYRLVVEGTKIAGVDDGDYFTDR